MPWVELRRPAPLVVAGHPGGALRETRHRAKARLLLAAGGIAAGDGHGGTAAS